MAGITNEQHFITMKQHEGLPQGLVATWDLDSLEKTKVITGTTVLIKDNTVLVWGRVLSDWEIKNLIKLPYGIYYY